MATASSLTGLRQLGKYTVSEVLGKGAMGLVYKGFDPHFRRTVALKTIRKKLAGGDDGAALLARFRTEAHAAGRLSHPGNAAVYEWGEAGELAFLAMEYVQGVSLREYFDGGRRFAAGDVVSIMVQLLDALHYAHEQGVWHRAIEPANIIIMSDGKLKVADFGIDRNGSSVPVQAYMAPEQHSGGPVDSRAEIFSAGVVLYQLLTGRHPFDGDPGTIARKICHEVPLPPSQVDPERCAARFDAVVMSALARRPEERYQSAQAFRDELLAAHAAPVSPVVAEEAIIDTALPPPARDRVSSPPHPPQPPEPIRARATPPEVPVAYPDPVPGEPSYSAEPLQLSSPEPLHPALPDPVETHAALAHYEPFEPAEPSLPPHPAPPRSSEWFPEPEHHDTHQPSEASRPPYQAPLPRSGSNPDPSRPHAMTASPPGWDEAVLKQIGRQLARLVGPIATLMVKRGAAGTTDVDTLYRVLAEQLTDRAERAVFLYGRNRLQGVPPRGTDLATGPQAAGTPSQPWGMPPSRVEPPQPTGTLPSGLEPSQPSAPHMDYAQPDTGAISAPGWDAAVLKQVERQLARLVGPVARLMVRRAAAVTTDVDELYRILADQLAERDMRTVLLYGWNRTSGFRPREMAASSELDQARATGPAEQSKPVTSAISPPGWDVAVLRQVEQQLARLVGPVARLLVRRGAAGTTDIDVLYRRLAENLIGKQDRTEFLEGRDRLQGVPPREVDKRSASVANQATCPDHEGLPAVNGDADGETPPSATHEETQRPR